MYRIAAYLLFLALSASGCGTKPEITPFDVSDYDVPGVDPDVSERDLGIRSDTPDVPDVSRQDQTVTDSDLVNDDGGGVLDADLPSLSDVEFIDADVEDSEDADAADTPDPGDSGPLHLDLQPACQEDSDCDDGDWCTLDSCGPDRVCQHPKRDCDDGNVCTSDICRLGQCAHDDAFVRCSTGNPCLVDEMCSQGVCQWGWDRDCNDFNPCTDDWCDPDAGGCVHRNNNEGVCNDQSSCTDNDRCFEGQCVGDVIRCEDYVIDAYLPCRKYSCSPERGCSYESLPGPCDDRNPCTADDSCQDGICKGTYACPDDDNQCTQDCNPKVGCTYEPQPDGTKCIDGDSCTTKDVCTAGRCAGVPKCTQRWSDCEYDICTPVTGGCRVEQLRNGEPCDDGNACTIGERCDSQVQCTPQAAVDCNDQVKCTADACDPATGCVWTLDTEDCNCDNNDAACEDHDPSTRTCCRFRLFKFGYRCSTDC